MWFDVTHVMCYGNEHVYLAVNSCFQRNDSKTILMTETTSLLFFSVKQLFVTSLSRSDNVTSNLPQCVGENMQHATVCHTNKFPSVP